ncbi:hypothetical protein KA017_01905 [Candidatus Woesebacteria bacterium]|nr:hypothetical protein [Candidatus Woesebacteria bacterium]
MTYTKHYKYNQLKKYLQKKHLLSKAEISTVKKHIDNCDICWESWNKVRWDQSKQKNGYKELEKYLGSKFELYHDSSWALANEWYEKKPSNEFEVSNFYKTTKEYVYNSLIFFESEDRKDFKPYYQLFKNKFNVKSIIDYGCGIGNDGLSMLENGFDVFFADFISPSTDFLQWRLENRNQGGKIKIFDVEQNVFPEVDMVWTIDALEHMTNPYDIFRAISKKTSLFVYFIDDDDQAGGRHPFHIPFDHIEFRKKLIDMGFSKQEHEHLSIWYRTNSKEI